MSKRPELLYNLSNAHERLGDPARALEFLNRYRAQAVLSSEEHEKLARKASTLELRMNEAEADRRTPGRTVTGVLGAVVGTAVVAVGGILGSIALDSQDEVRATCLDTPSGLLCPNSAEPAIRRAERNGTASLVLLGVGGVAVVSGVTLAVTASPVPRADVAFRVQF